MSLFAGVRRGDITANHVLGEGRPDDSTTKNEHVHIIMLDSLMR